MIHKLIHLFRQSLSQQGTPTPIESLASAGLVPEPIVSFKISRLTDNLNDGEITFGFVLILYRSHHNILRLVFLFLVDLMTPNLMQVLWLLFPTLALWGSGKLA